MHGRPIYYKSHLYYWIAIIDVTQSWIPLPLSSRFMVRRFSIAVSKALISVVVNTLMDKPSTKLVHFKVSLTISPTFYTQFLCQYFCSKKLQSQSVNWEKLQKSFLYKKSACKMLVKLTPIRRFNIEMQFFRLQ